MKIALLGYGLEGEASYQYFSSLTDTDGQPHSITICDKNTELVVPEGAEACLGEHYLDDLDRFDLLVRTPFLHPQHILDKNPSVGSKITSGTNEFLRHCPTTNIIGITGTKGKGTTSTLTAKMLEALGHTVHLGGNIGVPAISMLPNISPDDWVVLELSSFQLIDVQTSPRIATCLMMAPEHQDWHADTDEYYTAKEQLFARQTPGDIAIYFEENGISKQIASAGMGQKIPYYHAPGAEVIDGTIAIGGETICRTNELKLLGRHNWQNVCAAVTTVWYALQSAASLTHTTNPLEAMRSVLTSFSGLPFRLEHIRELAGVSYYNDSFGTTPETATVAIEAFTQPKVVILGGSDKGADYGALAKTVSSHNVRQVLLIGEQSARIQAALEAAGFTNFQSGGNTMDEIVAKAAAAAQAGDVVLLSTGCASFDMFKNYKDRGNQFTAAVKALPAPAAAA